MTCERQLACLGEISEPCCQTLCSTLTAVGGVGGVGSIIGKLRCAASWLEEDIEETQQK